MLLAWLQAGSLEYARLTRCRNLQNGPMSSARYYGVIEITRRGLPEPPTILSGAAITREPVGGS